MLDMLKKSSTLTTTENGAVTYSTSGSDCLDLFFRAGAFRFSDDEEIHQAVIRAFYDDQETALKTVFYARDVRGGLGERRFFRVAMNCMADRFPRAVRRNMKLIPIFGRFDDLLCFMGTRCEEMAISLISEQLSDDITAMASGESVSLLGKWLPSVNASSAETRKLARDLAGKLGMTEKQYRKTLSALRKEIHIVENDLRSRDYSFDYSKLPAGALFKYISAFYRNDGERYREFLDSVESGKADLSTTALYPYQIVRKCLGDLPENERRALDLTWKNLPALTGDNTRSLAVVDGSGSMSFSSRTVAPIDAALSLGIYFAEQCKGAFANHFITFSETPQLVEIKGDDIYSKVRYCESYNECANTNLEAVFRLILDTAVRNNVPADEIPARLYVISDMEFDSCVCTDNEQFRPDMTTLYEQMKKLYARHGYELPQVIFWNVAARNANFPVREDQDGTALVSGFSPMLFDMMTDGELSPQILMDKILSSPRYAAIH